MAVLEDKLKVQRKMNRYVKRSHYHAQNDQEDYVRNIVHANRHKNYNKEIERSNNISVKHERTGEIAA